MLASLGARTSRFLRSLLPAWRVLNSEQRVAAAGSILLIISTFGGFTFVEAAEILTALGVLLLLKRRADGYEFHLPFGDGTAIAAAGFWCGLLILVRFFDRPLGQNLLALACAALVAGAGLRERAKRPRDDLPAETVKIPRRAATGDRVAPEWERTEPVRGEDAPTARVREDDSPTERIGRDAERTERLREDDPATERIRGDDSPTGRLPGSAGRDPGSAPEAPPR
jgi:hypothetical protein